MRQLELSEEEIEAIHCRWVAGDPISKICSDFGHGTAQIRGLARDEGWQLRGNRDPLPAGHPLTWGLLTVGMAFQ